MADNVDVIQGLWDAFGKGDIDRAAGMIAKDGQIVTSDHLPWGGTYEGPEGFEHFLHSFSASFRDSKSKAVKILGSDDNHVTVVAHTSGRTKSGKQVEVEVLWLYQLRDGHIVSAQAYTDTAAILEALG
jgi:uncharacterized protein